MTPKDQETAVAIGATGNNGYRPKNVMLAVVVAGQNLKLLDVLGPSQNSLIPALGTSTGGLDHLQLN